MLDFVRPITISDVTRKDPIAIAKEFKTKYKLFGSIMQKKKKKKIKRNHKWLIILLNIIIIEKIQITFKYFWKLSFWGAFITADIITKIAINSIKCTCLTIDLRFNKTKRILRAFKVKFITNTKIKIYLRYKQIQKKQKIRNE